MPKTFMFQGWDQKYEMKIETDDKGNEVGVIDGFQFKDNYKLWEKMLDHNLPTDLAAYAFRMK